MSAGGGKVRENEACNHRPDDGDDSLHDEQPTPTPDPIAAFETACHSTGDDTTKRAAEENSRQHKGGTFRLLCGHIPTGDDKVDARGQAALEDTDNDAENKELWKGFDGTHAASCDTPNHHQASEVDGWPNAGDDEIGQRTAEGIADWTRACY